MKFLVEVEQFDGEEDLILWMGEACDDGEMDSARVMAGNDIDDEDSMDIRMEKGSTTVASFAMDWEELADFIADYAPHLIPKMVERITNEKAALMAEKIQSILEQ